MNTAAISLVFFLATVIVGIVCRVNCGFVAMITSFILIQFFAEDMSLAEIYKDGWPVSTFFMMMSVLLLFGIAGANGTMEIVAKRIIRLTGGRVSLLPLCVFLLTFVLSAGGAGPGIAPMMMVIAMGICRETGLSCFMMGIIIECGAGAGGMSPIATSGIIAGDLAASIGISDYIALWIPYIFVMCTESLAVYLFRGGHKAGKNGIVSFSQEVPAMNRHQKKTLAVILLVLCGMIFFKIDIPMMAMAGAAVLLILGVMEDKKAVAAVNWNTLLLVAGMYMLITVVEKCGGMALISDFLTRWITPWSGTGIMALLSGLMATVTSASGVVMPTLIPICGDIAAHSGGCISAAALTAGVAAGANCAFFSPFSVLGSMTIALYPEEADRQKLFRRHLQATVLSVAFVSILGFAGLLSALCRAV